MANPPLDATLQLTGPRSASRSSSRPPSTEGPFNSALDRALTTGRFKEPEANEIKPLDQPENDALETQPPVDDESHDAHEAGGPPESTAQEPVGAETDDSQAQPPAEPAIENERAQEARELGGADSDAAAQDDSALAPPSDVATGPATAIAEPGGSGALPHTEADAASRASSDALSQPSSPGEVRPAAQAATAADAATNETGDEANVANDRVAVGTGEAIIESATTVDEGEASAPSLGAAPTANQAEDQNKSSGAQEILAVDSTTDADDSPPSVNLETQGAANAAMDVAAVSGSVEEEVVDPRVEAKPAEIEGADAESQSAPREGPDRAATSLERIASQRSLQPASRTDEQQPLSTVDRARFVQRVSGALERAHLRDGRVQLRLSPPELGSLKIEIAVRQGVLTASIEADTNQARTVLLDNLPALRDRLAEQQIRVERFDVDVRRDGQQQPQDPGDRSGFADRSPPQEHRQPRNTAVENESAHRQLQSGDDGLLSDAALDVRI